MSRHGAGDVRGAAQAYREIIQKDPKNSMALHCLGAAEASLGNYAVAEQMMKRALDVSPLDRDILANYSNLLQIMGRHEDALPVLERALVGGVADPALIYAKAVCLFRLKRFEEALVDFSTVVSMQPANAVAIGDCGAALGELKRFDEALAKIGRASCRERVYGLV